MESDDQSAWQDAYRAANKPRDYIDNDKSSWIVTAVFVALGIVTLYFLLT